MAYLADESGREEVYVAPYPGPGRKVRISSEGGHSVRWSAQLPRSDASGFVQPIATASRIDESSSTTSRANAACRARWGQTKQCD